MALVDLSERHPEPREATVTYTTPTQSNKLLRLSPYSRAGISQSRIERP